MNMKKQWRAELRTLKKNRRLTDLEFLRLNKKLRLLIASFTRQINRNSRVCLRQTGRLDRRIAILEGRLS
jgi:hypothetical protein